ncbi:class Ib ribonucleoside-diphosphate reductase assembly flavoprotein NrdI [Streptococcus dysgalactiae]|uniref:class Ib ribonucleoside-diphosphate reductase assembly flavoprotein NrdI n=1 Tax=Streptococcus dysgalactiae TaxID=1334 RepID=UPI001CF40AD9|nr:class Ib ribonucleoside-diphosphate reductase assembly flavoprotein NrdI [Streptococcus dysgalactiae]MCB2828713.1 class Ib ribonucleoside-diphosphate reductase assembly flavoprotein NrdI [Streptococcus dysgalactiae subsp. dysgalactiae]MCB2842227.1 class Ib ribonucleoside-diphosphate reductase assembly flavoprotein NrdI [Streptococcus dysgalactiae subsp. dysgalactiae]MCB2849774.1 class Ib ribonucleoside-diphosphate reductase assembly flavoprotein NrdI [Streptococcus dysgalactiae subsp. dysgala
MSDLTIVFISLSGNTLSFVKRMSLYLEEKHGLHIEHVNIKQLKHETFLLEQPFVAVLPTYLEGGNGVTSGDVEILTNPFGDFIAAHDNYKRCMGIIGSGNKNFNNQYCLTAKQYAKRFNFPMLGDFELRGTADDIERLAAVILDRKASFEKES